MRGGCISADGYDSWVKSEASMAASMALSEGTEGNRPAADAWQSAPGTNSRHYKDLQKCSHSKANWPAVRGRSRAVYQVRACTELDDDE